MNGKHRKFWNELLPHVCCKKRNQIKNVYRGQRIGVNIVELLCADHTNYKDIVKCLFQQRTHFKPQNVMESIQKIHSALTVYAEVDPIYVFPGAHVPTLPIHTTVPEGRQNSIDYLALFRQRCDLGLVHDNSERQAAMKSARSLQHFPNTTIHVLANWMQSPQHNMTVVRAPFEVSWQLVHMELTGITTATLSSDPAIAIMGSTQQLVGATFGKKKTPTCFSYVGAPDWFGKENYRFNLLPYGQHYFPEVGALVGGPSMYAPRLPHSTVREVVETTVPRYLAAKEQRQRQQQQQQSGNRTAKKMNGEFVFWNRLRGATSDYRQAVERAIHLLRYCPVLQQQQQSNENHYSTIPTTTTAPSSAMQLVPLRPLPDGATLEDWKHWIGFDPVATLPVSPGNYAKAARFEDGYSFGGDTYLDEWCRGPTPSTFSNDEVELQYG